MGRKKKIKRKQKQKAIFANTDQASVPVSQTFKISEAIQTALKHHQAGQLQHAEHIYHQILVFDPLNADANHLLGVIANQRGQNDVAIHLIRKALKNKPDYPGAHYNLGNIFMEQGHLEKAAASYRKALSIKPNYAEAHNNLGVVLKEQGRLEEAAVNYLNALTIKPDYAEAHSNLGNVYKELKRFEEAAASYEKALTIQPDYFEAYNNLGIVLLEQERLEESAVNYRNALTIKPDFVEALGDLGVVLTKQGRMEEAVISYQKALNIKPDNAKIHSNLLLSLNYFSNVPKKYIYDESIRWDHQHAKKLIREEPVYTNKKENERKLKIGYVSPDFRTHPVAYFFEPLLEAHNKENFEVFCYSNVTTPDNVTHRLKANADNWLSIVGKSDEDVSKQIRSDGIDILIDLAGHTANNSLLVFACKPAPIQITWLGYPNTTGMSTIDYRFTDEIADPIGESDDLHSEELIRLEGGFLCYPGNESAPDKLVLPCLERGYVTFGSFNNLTKVTPEVVKLWGYILNCTPNSHLLLKSKQLSDKGVRTRYQKMFEKEGIPAKRIELFGWLTEKDHLDLYNKIDIALDPFPYNGTTTSCEALWMGVPVVTMLGDRHSGRVGASILTHTGLEELIAENPKSYVEIAIRLSKNTEKLAALRTVLRNQMMDSPLCDINTFARNVENAYIHMWNKYVALC